MDEDNICEILAAVFAAGTSAPYLAGFTSSGIAGGSLAAAIQAAIGNVAAGSAFAFLQSLGASTIFGTPLGAAGGISSAAAYYYMYC